MVPPLLPPPCLPTFTVLLGFVDLPVSHVDEKTQSEHGLSLDFSRLLVRFKIFLAWSWAHFQNSRPVVLRQTQGSVKTYSQNL